MVNGAALYYAVVTVLLVSLFTNSLILIVLHHNRQFTQLSRQDDLIQNANSGINLLLAKIQVGENDMEETRDLFETGKDSVVLKARSWGVFEVISAKSFAGKEKYIKSAITGSIPDPDKLFALYLADKNTPLSLAGSTEINGNIFVPDGRIQKAYIAGTNFTGPEIKLEAIRQSDRFLPSLNETVLSQIKKNWQPDFNANEIIFLDDRLLVDSLSQSFAEATKYFYSNSDILISDEANLKGNIVVFSEGSIEISTNAKIEDVVMVASSVLVSENFHGSLQIFATDSVKLLPGCNLIYPSALYLSNENSLTDFPKIVIENDVNFSGSLFAKQAKSVVRKAPILIIEEGAKVEGEVYVEGSAEVRGTLTGTLICLNLFLGTSSSSYENHLLNAKLDCASLSPHFVLSNLISTNVQRGIVKWVN